MKRCRYCNKQAVDGATECPFCRKPLGGSAAQQPHVTQSIPDVDLPPPTRGRGWKPVSAGLLLFLLALGGGGWWYWTRTPQYSLREVGNAIKTHDLAKFQKYVDVDGVTNMLVDSFVSAALKNQKPAATQWEQAGQNFGQGLIMMMKPRLAAEIKQKITELVEKPVDGQEVSASTSVERVQKQGKQATVDLRIIGRNGQPLSFRLRLREMGGYWQVAEVLNAADILGAAGVGR
jgi:hypothetical protein